MMKFHFSGRTNRAILCCFVCIALLISVFGCAAVGDSGRQCQKQPDGIEYSYRFEKEKPWSIHIVRIDRQGTGFHFVSTLASDSIIGLSTLTEQVASVKSQDYQPVAAVNGDFFRIKQGLYQGDPLGLQIMESMLISSPRGSSFWIDAQDTPRVGEVKSILNAKLPNEQELPFEINQERLADSAVLYTPLMGPSTRTADGMELILAPADTSTKAGEIFTAKVLEIRSTGNSPIKNDQVVLSIGPILLSKTGQINAGDTITISLKTEPDMTGVKVAMGGGPLLIRNGEPVKFTGEPVRHPRTAIGFNDNYYFLAVVDGRRKELSIGMSLQELGLLMLNLGCTEAINLDGGGSSTLWFKGDVQNSPSDGHERKVANGLVVMQKNREQEKK